MFVNGQLDTDDPPTVHDAHSFMGCSYRTEIVFDSETGITADNSLRRDNSCGRDLGGNTWSFTPSLLSPCVRD